MKYVQKSNGNFQKLEMDKITKRIENRSQELNVCPTTVALKTVQGLYDKIKTSQIDDLISEIAASMVTDHYDYSALAARIKASRLHKQTNGFKITTELLNTAGMLNSDYYNYVSNNYDDIESLIDYEKDFTYDYFGLCTLLKSYLLKIDDKTVERPQDLLMRCAISVTKPLNLISLKMTYDALSNGEYTHATPTLFNAGLKNQQLSSCYLLAMEDDSIDGIFNTVKDSAKISKTAGGIGIHAHNIRANGSFIKSTGGKSNGLIPFLKIFNETAKTVDQGGGKRKGSIAIYLEPWHTDIEQFLELRKNIGSEEFRARDLFYALWIPDLFMKRVKENGNWTLMSEDSCPNLSDVYGKAFDNLYEKYELENKGNKTIKARDLMAKIIDAQIETGQPYMLYKDICNRTSNQKNIGTIKSSNLCAEIIEYSDENETAVCNLASIALPKHVKQKLNDFGETQYYFDFDSLLKTAMLATKNLDNVIDINSYPTEKSKLSNMRNRPIGLGVQGLADVFFKLKIPYDSDKAKELNKDIFETIYFGAMKTSMELAKQKGPYSNYIGSPISEGKFQFNLYNQYNDNSRYNWDSLRSDILNYGVRNSLTTALMPTASTSNILGNTEAFQIQTSNIYKRQTLSGEFILVNKYLVSDLQNLGIWSNDIRDQIISNNGSVQSLGIPNYLKEIYKTTWEISQKTVIDMAADRQLYIDQSQSMNLWLQNPTFSQVYSMHLYSWNKQLKTGMYYLRSQPKVQNVKVTVSNINNEPNQPEECSVCSA